MIMFNRKKLDKHRKDFYRVIDKAYFEANYKRNCAKWGLDEYNEDGSLRLSRTKNKSRV